MQLDQINHLIDKFSLSEVERYLELLVDKINDTDNKIFREEKQDKKNELISILEGLHTLYETLFDKCRDLRKLNGDQPPKYFGKISLEQLDIEHRRAIAIDQDCARAIKSRRNGNNGDNGKA